MYKAIYNKSRALVIGINTYLHVSPLKYAVSDAEAVAASIKDQLGFDEEDITLLVNEHATRDAIFHEFMKFANPNVSADERIVVFFAGHGFTLPSHRAEVGYLMPYDGTPDDLATLLRWDDFTRNADLIPAKHILFIMDACYGGLAVTRTYRPGSMRFLRDMMQRTARQVLTAGKADEVVSDAGGPLPDHSVFTGHLLEAFAGKAEDNNGCLTATGVTSYVYQSVSADSTSNQTPHYGHVHGDGDMIFYPLPSEEEREQAQSEEPLITIPALNLIGGSELADQKELKELLSDRRHRIQLYDFVAQRTRELLSRTGDDYFQGTGRTDNEGIVERIHEYEEYVSQAIQDQMLLSRWFEFDHADAMKMCPARLAERITPTGGSTLLIEMRWYPIFLLTYSGLIGAIAGSKYEAIYQQMHATVSNPYGDRNGSVMLSRVSKAMAGIHDVFKLMPACENKYTPRSEYIHKFFQPIADEALFLGSGYESIYDRCELFWSLEFIHIDHPEPFTVDEIAYAHLGRFGYKHHESPLKRLIEEATSAGSSWPPLEAGLFGGSLERFSELAQALQRRVSRAGWY